MFHQYKISSKVEILINDLKNFIPNDKINETYKKIGFFFTDTNEKSDFQARELKSIHLDYQCHKIKFVMHRNHANMNNIFNQIGIVSLNIYGTEIVKIKDITDNLKINDISNKLDINFQIENQIKENQNIKKINNVNIHTPNFKNHLTNDQIEFKNNDKISNFLNINKSNMINTLKNINNSNLDRSKIKNNNSCINSNKNIYKENTHNSDKSYFSNVIKGDENVFKDKIYYLISQKETAIKEENYDKAKVICEFIKKLKDLSNKILLLEKEKKIAVDNEDFDRAKFIKNEINAIKNQAEFSNKDDLLISDSDKKNLNIIKSDLEIKKKGCGFYNILENNNEFNNNDFGKKPKLYRPENTFDNTNKLQKRRDMNINNISNNKKNEFLYNSNYENNKPQLGYMHTPNYVNRKIKHQLNKLMDSTQENLINNLYSSLEIKPSNKISNLEEIEKPKIIPENENRTIETEKRYNRIQPQLIKKNLNNKNNENNNFHDNSIRTSRNINNGGKIRIEDFNNSMEAINRPVLSPKTIAIDKNSSKKRRVFNRNIKEIFGSREKDFEYIFNSTELKSKDIFHTDRDDRAIKGINKDFSEFVMEKLKIDKSILQKEKEVIYKKMQNESIILNTEKNDAIENTLNSKNNPNNNILKIKNENNKTNKKESINETEKENLENSIRNKSPKNLIQLNTKLSENKEDIKELDNQKEISKINLTNIEENNGIVNEKNINQMRVGFPNILQIQNKIRKKHPITKDIINDKKLNILISKKNSENIQLKLLNYNIEKKEIKDLTKISERILTEENLITKNQDENESKSFHVIDDNYNNNKNSKSNPMIIKDNDEGKENSEKNYILEHREEEDRDKETVTLSDAKPLYNFLSYNIIKMLFSKNWKIRERALRVIEGEVLNYPNLQETKIFGSNKILDIYYSIVYSSVYILSSNILPLFIICLNLFKLTLKKFQKEKDLFDLVQKKKSELNNLTTNAIELIIQKLGDINPKVRDIAEASLTEISNFNLVGEKLLLEILINGKSINLKGKSPKYLLAKLLLINKIINLHGIYKYSNSILIENIINYAKISFDNISKEIREESINILLCIYNLTKDKNNFITKNIENADTKIFDDFKQKLSFLLNEKFDDKKNKKSNSFKMNDSSLTIDKNYDLNIIHKNQELNDKTGSILLETISINNFINNTNKNSSNKQNKIKNNESLMKIKNSKNKKIEKNYIENSLLKNRSYSSKNENSRQNNKNEISNIDYNNDSSIKIIINNNNFNYNCKNKDADQLKINLTGNHKLKENSENRQNNIINKFRYNANSNKNFNDQILNLNNSIDKILLKNEDKKFPLIEKKERNFLDFHTIDNNNYGFKTKSIVKPIYINMNENTKQTNKENLLKSVDKAENKIFNSEEKNELIYGKFNSIKK